MYRSPTWTSLIGSQKHLSVSNPQSYLSCLIKKITWFQDHENRAKLRVLCTCTGCRPAKPCHTSMTHCLSHLYAFAGPDWLPTGGLPPGGSSASPANLGPDCLPLYGGGCLGPGTPALYPTCPPLLPQPARTSASSEALSQNLLCPRGRSISGSWCCKQQQD